MNAFICTNQWQNSTVTTCNKQHKTWYKNMYCTVLCSVYKKIKWKKYKFSTENQAYRRIHHTPSNDITIVIEIFKWFDFEMSAPLYIHFTMMIIYFTLWHIINIKKKGTRIFFVLSNWYFPFISRLTEILYGCHLPETWPLYCILTPLECTWHLR